MSIKKLNKYIAFFIFSLFCVLLPQYSSAQAAPQNVRISLLSSAKSVAPGETFYIALKQDIAPEWHTYWRNPGDVGDATTIEWEAPKGVTIGNIEWPAPKRLPYAEFINYGYDRQAIFPIKVTVPANFSGDLHLIGNVSWLECKDVCIPGDGKVEITIKVGQHIDSANKAPIEAVVNALPAPLNNYKATISKDNARLFLGIQATELNSKFKGIKSVYFYPYELESGSLIDHAKPQELTFGNKGFGIYLTPSMSLPEQMPPQIKGLIEVQTKDGNKYYEITANNDTAKLAGTFGQKPHTDIDVTKLIQSMAFAFFGGLILNLMPCVFPILAMKVFGLTKVAHTRKNYARHYGLFYFLGVLITFTVLGGLIFALKSFGASIGWGFQLQSPIFLMLLITLIFAVGFNLLGLFEIGTSLQNIGIGNNATGNAGALFSGILAVLVASPCTAPFMGVALGYAATQPAIIGLLVFVALGFGFALPFVILTFFPSLLSKLPKPGPWLDTFKKILAIPMFLTAAWLIWVLSATTGMVGVIISILLGFVYATALKFLLRENVHKVAFIGIAMVISLLVGAVMTPSANAETQIVDNHKPWSDQAVNEALAQGKIVFVDFTADWCITCKVNEASSIKTSKVQKVFKDNNVEYLVADWTKKDENIARALSSHGRAGVPLYLVYRKAGEKPLILPQLLTPQIVINSVEGR